MHFNTKNYLKNNHYYITKHIRIMVFSPIICLQHYNLIISLGNAHMRHHIMKFVFLLSYFDVMRLAREFNLIFII
jgi:hypothetical protein